MIVSKGKTEFDKNGRERIGEFCDFGTKGTKGQFKHSKSHKGQILYFNEKGAVKVMPVYANIKTTDVKEKLQNMGCKLYNKGQMFSSGCLIEIPKEFKAGKETYTAGIYKLTSMWTSGVTEIKNGNGIKILTSAKNLVEAGFRKYNQ